MTGVHEHEGSSLRHYLNVFRRRKWLIVAITVAITALAVGLSLRQQKMFAASAEVYLNTQNLSNSLTNIATSSDSPDRVAQTQADLAGVPTVAKRALALAHVTSRTPNQLAGEMSVSILPNANILHFTVTDHDARLAVVLANAYANSYTGFEQGLSTSAIQGAKTQLESKLAELAAHGQGTGDLAAALRAKDRQLDTLAALQTTNAYVIRTAQHSGQVAPRPTRNAILAFVLGLMLAIGVAFLRETLDTRVRTADEVASRLGIPLLTRVPYSKGRKAHNQLAMLDGPNNTEAEAYRALRTNLDFVTLDRGVRTLMVTSALEQEGKSTAAANLSIALALGGSRVALIDLDLRRPTVAKIFGLEGAPGITEVALGRVSLDDALQRVAITEGGAGTAASNGSSNGHGHARGSLEVLTSGPLPPDPGEFMGTESLRSILNALRDRTDIVIIDSPPTLSVSDPITLSAAVDAMVIVTRLNVVRRPMLTELHRRVDASPAKKLGFIVIGGTASDYGSYYYYEQLPQAQRLEPAERVH